MGSALAMRHRGPRNLREQPAEQRSEEGEVVPQDAHWEAEESEGHAEEQHS